MVNHFPNITLLTTKIGLLESLRMWSRLHALGNHTLQLILHSCRLSYWCRLELNSVIPQNAFRLDVAAEKAEFEEAYKGQSVTGEAA